MNRTEQKQKTLRSINYLAIKCNEDVSFKRKLFEDPIGTISKLDQNFRFDTGKIQKFEDQTDRSIIFLNIPQQPTLDDFELKEEELEMVAGGVAANPTVGSCNFISCIGFADESLS